MKWESKREKINIDKIIKEIVLFCGKGEAKLHHSIANIATIECSNNDKLSCSLAC